MDESQNIMLKKPNTKGHKRFDPFIWCIQNRQIHKDTIHLWLPRAGRKGNGKCLLIGMRISIYVSLIYLSIHPSIHLYIEEEKFLGHMVILCLTFWGTVRLFSKAVAPHFTVPSAKYEGSNFFISLPTLLLFFSYYSHPTGIVVASYHVFLKYIFIWLLWVLVAECGI